MGYGCKSPAANFRFLNVRSSMAGAEILDASMAAHSALVLVVHMSHCGPRRGPGHLAWRRRHRPCSPDISVLRYCRRRLRTGRRDPELAADQRRLSSRPCGSRRRRRCPTARGYGVPGDLTWPAPTPSGHNGSPLAGCRGGSRCSLTAYGARSILSCDTTRDSVQAKVANCRFCGLRSF